MILIKVLTKTKYLSFHFAFECAQRGFVCTTPFQKPETRIPRISPGTAGQATSSLSSQKIQYAFGI